MPKKQTKNSHQKSSHRHRKPAHGRPWWFAHYQAWQNSGLSKTNYCTLQGLNLSIFVNWTTRFKAGS